MEIPSKLMFNSLIIIYIMLAVHYEGILEETGEVFDTTHEDNTIFSFEIGKGSVIKAWDIAVKTMKVKISFSLRIFFLNFLSPLLHDFSFDCFIRLGRLLRSLASQNTPMEVLVLRQISHPGNAIVLFIIFLSIFFY